MEHTPPHTYNRRSMRLLTTLGIMIVLIVAGLLTFTIIRLGADSTDPNPTSKNELTPSQNLPRSALISSHPQLAWEQYISLQDSAAAYTTLSYQNNLYIIGISNSDNTTAQTQLFAAQLTTDGTLTKLITLPSALTTSINSHVIRGDKLYLLTQRDNNGVPTPEITILNLTTLSFSTPKTLGSPIAGETPKFLLDSSQHLYIISESSQPTEYKHTLSVYKVDYELNQLKMTRSHRSAQINLLHAQATSDSLMVFASAKAGLAGYLTAYTYSIADTELNWRNVVLPDKDLTIHTITPTVNGYVLAASNNLNHSSAVSITLDSNLNPLDYYEHHISAVSASKTYLSSRESLLSFISDKGGNLNLYSHLNSYMSLPTIKGTLAHAEPLPHHGFIALSTSNNYTSVSVINQGIQRTIARTLAVNPTSLILSDQTAIVTAHKHNSVYIFAITP